MIGRSRELVGRDAEGASLAAIVDHLATRGAALVIRGEPGIGKSALLLLLREQAEARGFAVLTTAGVEAEAELPFAGLHQLLLPIMGSIDTLSPAQRRSLEAALGITAEDGPDAFRVAVATLRLVSSAAEAKPLVLIVDDAHWLDRSSLDVLRFVARRVEGEPLALVAALRPGHTTGFDESHLPILELRRLSAEASAELLDRETPGLHPILRAHILAEAAGNPLALVELGRILPLSPQATGAAAAVPISLNTRLQQAFAARLGGLSDPTRLALLAAALDSRASLGDVLRAATLLHRSEISLEALQPAIDAALVDVTEHQLQFRHPLIRAAVRQAASRAQLIAMHRALATVVEDPERNVWHRASSTVGADEDVASALEEHARAAKRRGAVTAAAAAFERAAMLTADPQRKGDRLMAAAELAYELGRGDVVQRLLTEANRLSLSSTGAARVAWLQQMTSGNVWSEPGAAKTFVSIARQLADADDTAFALESLEPIAHRCWWTRCQLRTREYVVEAAMSLGVPADDPRVLAVSALAHPEQTGPVVLDRVSHMRLEPSADPVSAMYLGIAAEKAGDSALGTRYLAAAVSGLRGQARLGVLTQALTHYAWAATYADDWESARMAAEEAAVLARDTAQPQFGLTAQFISAIVAALRGEAPDIEATVAQADMKPLTAKRGPLLATAHLARGAAALGEGRYDAAFEHLWPVFDEHDPVFHRFMRWQSVLDLVESAVRSGNADRTTDIVAELEQIAGHSGPPILRVGLICASPLLVSDAEAEAHFRTALEHDLTSFAFLRARTLFSFGSWLRRHRRSAEARRPLRASMEVFDALGGRLWSQRGRQELRATGETVGSRTPDLHQRLTAQELQIAQLAADGLSNREIGERLFLSHRTVGSHLYRIFPKLGITGRGQLRDRLPVSSELADSVV
jgi:DNA-binding CsgD family transcriptional regulator/tetratricopeptide (TPR) repeat protein